MTTEVMERFVPPTPERVAHALRELSYEERLVGHKMTPSAGNSACEMYSLAQAVVFLLGNRWDAPLLSPGFKGTINWIDIELLVNWLRDVVGDPELADAIESQAMPLDSYRLQMERLGELFAQRMRQYREVRDGVSPA